MAFKTFLPSLLVAGSFSLFAEAHDYQVCLPPDLPPASYNSSAYVHSFGLNFLDVLVCTDPNPSPSTCVPPSLGGSSSSSSPFSSSSSTVFACPGLIFSPNSSTYLSVAVGTVTAVMFQYHSSNSFHWHPITSTSPQFVQWPPKTVDFEVNISYPSPDSLLCDTNADCPANIQCITTPAPARCQSATPSPPPSPPPPVPIPSPSPGPTANSCNLTGSWEQPHSALNHQHHQAIGYGHSADAFITITSSSSSSSSSTTMMFSCTSSKSLCPGNKTLVNGTFLSSTTTNAITLVPSDGSASISGIVNNTFSCNLMTIFLSPSTNTNNGFTTLNGDSSSSSSSSTSSLTWNSINPAPPPVLNLDVTMATFLGIGDQQLVATGVAILSASGNSEKNRGNVNNKDSKKNGRKYKSLRAANSLSSSSSSSTTTTATPAFIAVAGNGQAVYPGITPITLLNANPTDNGTIVIIQVDVSAGKGSGGTVVQVVKVGTRIDHIRANVNGLVAVAGSFGVAVISGLLSQKTTTTTSSSSATPPSVVWHDDMSDIIPGSCGICCSIESSSSTTNCKVDIGDDGVVAVDYATTGPTGDLWGAYTATGERFWTDSRADAASLDAVVVNSKNNQIAVSWFYNSNTGKEPMVMPAVNVYSYASGTSKAPPTFAYRELPWDATVYRAPGPCDGDVADGRVMGLRESRVNGELLFLGRSDGGNSPFQCGLRNVSRVTPMAVIDGYTSAYNMQAQAITNFLRIDSITGEVIVAQMQLVRLPNTQGNTLVTVAGQADEEGNVYLLQNAACCMPYMSNLTINGQALMGPGDTAALQILTPNLERRLHWTGFAPPNATGKTSEAVEIDVRGNTVALVLTSGTSMITVAPLSGTTSNSTSPGSGSSPVGYLVVFPVVGMAEED